MTQSLSLPQARIPLGWALVNGQRVPVEIDQEWMRALLVLVNRSGGVMGNNDFGIDVFSSAGVGSDGFQAHSESILQPLVPDLPMAETLQPTSSDAFFQDVMQAQATDLSGPIASSNGVTSVTSQTGTGSKFVMDTSPTMTTPKATTTIGVGNTTPSASGAGISFPATQSASTDVNTLDDYEEGTWTPGQGSGLTVVGAYSSSGSYTKVGNLVTVIGQINGATSVSIPAGGLLVSGLPFTTGSAPAVAAGGLTNLAVTATSLVIASGTNLYATTAVAATATMYFSITYRTA